MATTAIDSERSHRHSADGPDHAALAASDPEGRLYNEDLAPSEGDGRHWDTYSVFAFWSNTSHNLGAYTFAAGLFALGLNAWEVTLGILGGAIIVFFGCLLSGQMGQTTGVPFPVISRMSWGVFGANAPALIRALAAIAWYGIQTFLAAIAINAIFERFLPGMSSSLSAHSFLGLDLLSWISFMLLWAIQLAVLTRGMEVVRHAQGFSGAVIWLIMVFLAVWLLVKAHGHISLTTGGVHLSAGQQVYHVFAAMGLMMGILGTLMLNYADFTRFAPSRRTVVRGSFWGVPVNWAVFAITAVLVSSGTKAVYGHSILDPADIFKQLDSDVLLLVGAVLLVLAAVGVNIVANFVSPAFDIANVSPKHISFRRGGLIAAFIALASLPWKLYSSPTVVNYFLGGLGALIGPLFGIMIVDYFVIKRRRVNLSHLYLPTDRGDYYFQRGVNRLAVAAFVPSATVAVIVAVLPALSKAAPFAWFVGAGLSAALYAVVSRKRVAVGAESAVEGSGTLDPVDLAV